MGNKFGYWVIMVLLLSLCTAGYYVSSDKVYLLPSSSSSASSNIFNDSIILKNSSGAIKVNLNSTGNFYFNGEMNVSIPSGINVTGGNGLDAGSFIIQGGSGGWSTGGTGKHGGKGSDVRFIGGIGGNASGAFSGSGFGGDINFLAGNAGSNYDPDGVNAQQGGSIIFTAGSGGNGLTGYIGGGNAGTIYIRGGYGGKGDGNGIGGSISLYPGLGTPNGNILLNCDPLYGICSGFVGINTTSPSYPLDVRANASGISIYASANISAKGYVTRTTVYNKASGSAIDKVKDASAYLDKNGNIDHKSFGDTYITYTMEVITGYKNITYKGYQKEVPVYENITEEGVSLDGEVALLKQAIYDMKTEVCTKDKTYSWCIK